MGDNAIGITILFLMGESDKFDHELLIVIKEHDGLVIFTGCAHSGVLNMVDTAISYFLMRELKQWLGAFT